jgi:large subunit ribosomal protein L16
MQYTPKKTKHKKQHKGKKFNAISPLNTIEIIKSGCVALKSVDTGRIKATQLIACKQTINKIIKKLGRLKVNVIADTPITKKPLEIRMGKGKGAVDHWVSKIKFGIILFEIETSSTLLGIKALKIAQSKLPLKTKIIFE